MRRLSIALELAGSIALLSFAVMAVAWARDWQTVDAGSQIESLPSEAVRESPLVAAGYAEGLTIESVESAAGAAQRTLVDDYKVSCLMSGHGAYVFTNATPERLDERIEKAGLRSDGWLNEGEVWIGSATSAVNAFHAVAAFDDGHSMWIVRETQSGPQARELLRLDSATGVATWRLLDQVSECDSEDPASDDEKDHE